MDARLAEVRRAFSHHRQRARRILLRLRRAGRDLEHLTESDLAEDPRSGFTDQNHVGSRELTLALGERAGIRRGMRVLDSCCGIGGTARVLADSFGCHAVGIEITPARCRDAVALSRRVGLGGDVGVVLGDACALPFTGEVFDAVVSQSAWSHVTDKRRLLLETARVLRRSGVLAFEDAVRGPRAGSHEEALHRLSRYWCFSLETAAAWREHVSAASLRVEAIDDLTNELQREARRTLETVRAPYRDTSRIQRSHWTEVLRLVEAGALGYFRIVARRGSRM
ncbi:MAG: class I SAM-dependent methyltransferase [Myxococcales bacterium]